MLEKIKVMIVDDLEDWLKAISKYLRREKDIEIVGTAVNREDALSFIKQNDIDIILLDINLSCNNYDGIDALVEISEIKDDVKVIMMTSLKSEDVIKKSFLAGAVNYVFKDDYLEIPNIIRKAYKDNLPISVILNEYRIMSIDKYNKIQDTLTPCEKELLIKKQKGYSNKELAQRLNKSENTIKSQTRSIIKKFNGKSIKDIISLFSILKKDKH